MKAIDKIEVQSGKYVVFFRYDEGQSLSVEYTHDEFHAMLNLIKQASIANSGNTIAQAKKAETDLEEVKDVLEKFKVSFMGEVVEFVNQNNKILRTDYEYVRDIVNKVESERSSLLIQLNSGIKTQLDNVQTLLDGMKKIEERSYSTVLTREAEVLRVIESIKKKNDKSNESIDKMMEEIKKSKDELDSIKAKELKRIDDIIKRQTAIIESATKASMKKALEVAGNKGFFARIKGLFGK